MKVKENKKIIGFEVKEYEPIIGLEIHVELKTKSKMFCGCLADYFGHKPNTHCCPVCLGLPGSLPVPNRKAIEWTIMVGLALNCKIPLLSKFDRKNYFYPDLPKGYQISQYDMPFAVNGELKIKNEKLKSLLRKAPSERKNTNKKSKIIRIRRVHLEEDTGKMIHTEVDGKKCTLIDFNRSGVPLLEIVTEPDIRSGEEARVFLQKLQQILRYLEVSECDMEKGSMRCEPNVSVRRWALEEPCSPIPSPRRSPRRGVGATVRGVPLARISATSDANFLPDYKVEIKNLNSFRFVKKAIDYEIERQIKILKKGGKVRQETRGWDEKKNITLPQRGKEVAADYRYFPEPDIPPIRWRKSEITKLQKALPELPEAKMARFMKNYGLSQYDARVLTAERKTADYYDEAIGAWQVARGKWKKKDAKEIANWIINKRVDIGKVLPAELVKMILKKLAPPTMERQKLEKIVNQVLLDNQKAVRDYKRGKRQALMFLVGQVMGRTKSKADPKEVRGLLKSNIKYQISK